jgi:hypothetical protein
MVQGDCSTKGATHLDLTIHQPGSDGTLGNFKAFHFCPDSCFPVVADRFFCEATYSLKLQEHSGMAATFIGTIQEGGNCAEEVKSHTPKRVTIMLRRIAENSIDVDCTSYGGWDPEWFSHRTERVERSKQ